MLRGALADRLCPGGRRINSASKASRIVWTKKILRLKRGPAIRVTCGVCGRRLRGYTLIDKNKKQLPLWFEDFFKKDP